jgi:branched-chain amino acid transport system permease protein
MITPTLVLQVVLAGVTNGFVYALIGLGLAVIYKGSNVLNAAQGDFAIVGAMVTVLALDRIGMPYWLAIFAGVAAGAALAALTEVLCVRPMLRRKASDESMLLLTVGLAFMLGAIVLVTAGRAPIFLPPIGGDILIDVFEATIQRHAVILIVVATLVVGALALFYKRTHLGQSMMAASIDPDGATTVGINVAAMRTATFVLGGIVGAIGGVLQTPLIGVSFAMGIAVTLKGVAAAILGGLTNPMGAVVGGLVLGLAEAFAVILVDSGYQNIVAMMLLIAIMIVAPNGLFAGAIRRGG